MLQRTTARLEELMQGIPQSGDDRVFHYLPLCFAGSWILLLTCLYRNNNLMLSTDLNRLAEEWKLAQPQYMLNVPALLERIRTGVEEKVRAGGGVGWLLFSRGQSAWLRQQENRPRLLDPFWLALARRLVFAKIRDRIGSDLRALICGSAPLAVESQRFFELIGIPVLQVYGLTETTAICTMDDVRQVTAGRVGPAIPGIQMRVSSQGEILVKGPNIFPGYWNRPQANSEVFQEGWFRTGDQGEVDTRGNWENRRKNEEYHHHHRGTQHQPGAHRATPVGSPAGLDSGDGGRERPQIPGLPPDGTGEPGGVGSRHRSDQPATAALPSDPPVSYRRRTLQRRKWPARRQRKAAESGHRGAFPERDRLAILV